MKHSNDTIGNRSRDLPVCGAVHQITAPPPIRTVSTANDFYNLTLITFAVGVILYDTIRYLFTEIMLSPGGKHSANSTQNTEKGTHNNYKKKIRKTIPVPSNHFC
jgi:hypothetical protein